MKELIYTSATKLAEIIREKQVSSEEVVSAHIQRIEAVNPKINAIVQFRPEQALKEARAADEALARGDTLGPLHGVPFTVKDYMAIKGVISTYGTLGLANNIMDHDCEVVTRLRKAGGIALGNTNMAEFGASIESDNLIYGRTNNPYDLERFPGGSSGGESAIIAAGGSPLGVGGDSGGSIREPAHYCGIAGIKPTTGRIPRTGFLMQPRGATSFKSQNGPMARYVRDLILGLEILSGPDGRDSSVMPIPLLDPTAVDLKTLRVAYYTDNGITTCTPEVVATVMKAVDALKQVGVARIDEAQPPGIASTYDLYSRLSTAVGAEKTRQHLKALGTEQVSDYMQRMLSQMETKGSMDAADLEALTVEWDLFKDKMLGFMNDYDLIVSPTTSIPAMPHRSSLADEEIHHSFTYCATYNLTGWPAATVRCGSSPEGLPIGVQTVARPWREDVALAAALYLETTFGGYTRPTL